MPSIKERSLRCSLVQGDDNEHVDNHVEDHVDCDVDQKHSSLMTDSVDENKQREGCGSMITASAAASRNNTNTSHQRDDDGIFVDGASATTKKSNPKMMMSDLQK